MAKYVIISHLLGIYVTKKYQSTKYVSGLGPDGLHVGGGAVSHLQFPIPRLSIVRLNEEVFVGAEIYFIIVLSIYAI